MRHVVCNRTRPPPTGAKAVDFIGINDTALQAWVCKGQDQDPLLPATEWLCAQIALACGLPVPPVAVVEVLQHPGRLYFGSLWQSGALDFAHAAGHIGNAGVFAAAHALDLFINNTDRHRANFLYLVDVDGQIVAEPIDYNHAFLEEGWPLPALPLPAHCNTTKEWPILLKYGARDVYARPDGVIAAIAGLSKDWMRDQLRDMPSDWLPHKLARSIDRWWRGQGRTTRLQQALAALP